MAKCAALSSEVRWSWLRGRTLFSFSELRTLLRIFLGATTTTSSDNPHRQLNGISSTISTMGMSLLPAPSSTTSETTRLPSPSSSEHKVSSLGMMDKAQFLSMCESKNEHVFCLSQVVGAFGSRLFDVLDGDGDGKLGFDTFAIGLSKLLKVRTSLFHPVCA